MSASAPERGSGKGGLVTTLWRTLDERFQLGSLVDFLRHKEIPVSAHSQIWYYFGGVALFFFTVQIGTGILLLMYYQVGESTSYESMKFLVGHVPFGWLIRSIHCWSAHLMSLSVVIHLLSVLFTKAYRKPREITWYSGVLLFAMVLGFGFSGYLLPWNELSYFATAVGTDSVKSVPVLGPWLLRVLRGGEEVSAQTLYRFFALHVCILPLVIAGVIGLHLLLIQRQGMAKPLRGHDGTGPARRGMPFFPNFALRDLLLWVICLDVLAILAVLLPYGPGIPGMEWELGSKANPLKPAYPGIKPEWYFLWVYQMLKEFPAHLFGLEGPQLCLLVVNVIALVAFFLPVIDRKSAREERSPEITDLAVAGILFVSFLTLKAWDIGVHVPKGQDPGADPALAATIARTAALVTLALGGAVDIYRWRRFKGSYFAFSLAVLLQAVLHGFAGVSWLASAAVAAILCAAWIAASAFRDKASTPPAAVLALLLLPSLLASRVASAETVPAESTRADVEGHVPDASWPKEFRALFDEKEKGKPVLGEKEQARFRSLPAHAQELAFSSLQAGILSSAKHLATLLALDLDNKKLELVLGDNCVVCHTNPDMPDEIQFRSRPDKKAPFAYLDLAEVVSDVHFRRGLGCAGCHGGKPTDKEMADEIHKRWPAAEKRKTDRTWIPAFCARCHSSSEFMRQFNPKLPVDQLEKYRTSKHGQLLLAKNDSKAAQCVSCHGVHGIRSPESPLSLVNAANVPATCGRCHADAGYMKGYTMDDGKTPLPTNQLTLYRQSVHGKALLEKHDTGAPACNGCNGHHAEPPPETAAASPVWRNCHSNNGTMFDGSPHKKAFEAHGWPECATCHGTHDIRPPADEWIGSSSKTVCGGCHAKYGKPICNETANFFRSSIVSLRDKAANLDTAIERLGERGFDLDELRFQESSTRDGLRKTRQAIHTFDRSDFTQNLTAATKEVDALNVTIEKLKGEYRYRRNGLLLATALIVAFGGLLYAKIRETDRDSGYKP